MFVKNKTAVVSLVEREGRVRSQVVDKVTGEEITKVLKRHVAEDATLNTDESPVYWEAGKQFAGHESVIHAAEEYSRETPTSEKVTTNSAEGFSGNSKRAIDSTHHHISRKHTGVYFSELDYKYNTRKVSDGARTVKGIQQMAGKRLMLRTPRKATPQ